MNEAIINILSDKITATEKSLAKQQADLAELATKDPDAITYCVNIINPWDGSGGKSCSVYDLYARGLADSIRLAEQTYRTNSGGALRTDGVLEYGVAIALTSGEYDLPVSEWGHLTSQPADSLRVIRE